MFERKLVNNMRDCLKKKQVEFKEIKRLRNRIVIYTNNKCDCLKYVFGIINFSPAIKTEADMESIKKITLKFIKKLNKNKSFRVSAKNLSNKKMRSMDINIKIGAFIQNKTKAKVSLEKFDFELGVEVIDNEAYVFSERVKCFGGLPVGIEGGVAVLVEDKKSILAALMVMKRGCSIFPVSFDKVNINLLKKYSYGYDIELTKVKSMRDIEKIAEEKELNALVVGQTLDDFKDVKTNLVVLKPLIVFSEKEINEKYNLFDV